MKRLLLSFARTGLVLLTAIGIHSAHVQANALVTPADLPAGPEKSLERPDRPDTLDAGRVAPVVRILSKVEAAAATAALNCTLYCGVPVSYTSWKGDPYTLQQYTGRNVTVLVPQHWYDDPTFTVDARRQFIDAFDVTYQYLNELVGDVPSGTNPIPIAFVNPPGCGWGCGSVGGRGVEITDAPSNSDNEFFWATTETGFHSYGIVHEMTHNYDVYGGQFEFSTLPDASHYWTYIMRSIYAFTRTRASDTPPEEYDVSYEQALLKYVQTASATWQTCVISQTCDGAINGYNVPIGVFYRLMHLYGRKVETRYTAFQKARKVALPSPTDQDKIDGFFEGYSAAANRNMNCLWDMLSWPVSQTARTWANSNFPNANPDCTTLGPGGSSVIVDIKPDTMSIVDGSYDQLQDTGNGDTDESACIFGPTLVTVPALVSAQAIANQYKCFQFTGSGNNPNGSQGHRRVRMNFCSPANGFAGGTWLWNPSVYPRTAVGGPSFTAGACNTSLWQHTYDVNVEQRSAATGGAYSIQVEADPYGPWPLSQLWAHLSVTRNGNGSFTLSVSQIDATQVLPTATQVRFWVQNYGWVATKPWQSPVPATLTATWTPPANETGEGLVFRAQVLGAPGEGYASDQANPVIYLGDTIFRSGFEIP